MHSCHCFIQSTERDVKLEDVTSAVLEHLSVSCADCRISSDIIDRQSFACYPESPTYRARLEDTSEADSGSLISLIEEWVSGGRASIIVTGVLMTVDSKCSIAISSLSEGECFPIVTQMPTPDNIPDTEPPTMDNTTASDDPSAATDQTTTDNSAATIGGVVAIVLIIAITITVIVIAVLVMKNRRRNLSIENRER